MSLRTPGGRANGRKKVEAYGVWPSPIAAEAVGGQTLRLQLVQASGPWVYWSEGRPSEGGRVTVMRARSSGRPAHFRLRCPCWYRASNRWSDTPDRAVGCKGSSDRGDTSTRPRGSNPPSD